MADIDQAAVGAKASDAATTNGSPSAAQASSTLPKTYAAEIGEQRVPISPSFAEAMLDLEKSLGMPLWFLIQNGDDAELGHNIEQLFFTGRHALPQNAPVALFIESPGGSAHCAYRIAKLLQKRCGSFTAVVANWAKSAATLLSLGASQIVLGDRAQLGPLDVQIFDADRENLDSALNETQAFERLHAAALEAIDQTVMLLRVRTGKRIDAILPHTLKFIADTMRPLLEKVDVVQYTNRLRTLKVAEEYALRLLQPRHSSDDAKRIARTLVERYPEHGFVIDFDEAKRIGLNVVDASAEQNAILDRILLDLSAINVVGKVVQT